LVVIPDVYARASDGDLQGVKRFQLFVTGLDKEASRACGLQSDGLKAAFRAPLEAAGAVVVPPSNGFWIALQATTARREPDTCATFVEASVLQNSPYYNRAAAAERDGKVLLWTRGELVLSDSAEHGRVVHDVFEKLGRRLAEAWRGGPLPEQMN